MDAKKCDRCDAYFDEKIDDDVRIVDHRKPSVLCYISYTYDLCPVCYRQLKNWIDKKAEIVYIDMGENREEGKDE